MTLISRWSSQPPPDLLGGERSWRLTLRRNGQCFHGSCPGKEASLKPRERGSRSFGAGGHVGVVTGPSSVPFPLPCPPHLPSGASWVESFILNQ